MKILEYARNIVFGLLVVWYATSLMYDYHDQRIKLNIRRNLALDAARRHIYIALIRRGRTDPARLIESCVAVPGVVCESNGDIITMSFFPDGSRKKLHESERWKVTKDLDFKYIGLVE